MSWGAEYAPRLLRYSGPIAPADLLDVKLANGERFYWANRRIAAQSVITADGVTPEVNLYLPWLISAPKWTFHRTMDTDMGQFSIQNATGNSMQRDFERIMTRTTMQGAFFVYRAWQAGAELPWIEVHGELSFDEIDGPLAHLDGKQLFSVSADDMPQYIYGEVCPLEYGEMRCGATDPEPCKQTFATCKAIERPLIVLNNFQKNFTETTAATPQRYVDRRRRF